MSTESKAIKTMADEVTKAIKRFVDDNNKEYVLNALKSGKYGGSGSFSGTIDASQITNLYSAVSDVIINAPEDAQGGDPVAIALISVLNNLSDLRIQSATIDTAQIEDLYASYADFIYMVADTAQITDLDVVRARASMAQINTAAISSATIESAQINVSTTQTAFIREGIGGKYYIDNLAVSEANIVNLAVGNLMINDSQGKLVKIKVDEHGEVVVDPVTGDTETDVVTFNGGDVLNNNSVGDSLISSVNGSKLVANSVTASKLNASEIFAAQGTIMDLVSSNINTTNLMAISGFIGSLATNLITNTTMGDDIDISDNASITLLDGLIELMIDSSSPTVLSLKPGFVSAIADEIDLSANNTVRITSANQISATAANAIDLSSNNTINITSANQISATAVNALDLSSNNTVRITSANQISATAANAIDLSSNDTIRITAANQISATAVNNLDLSSNNTVRITSANQISATAASAIDLSANNTIYISSADQIDIAAANALNLEGNETIQLVSGNLSFEIDSLSSQIKEGDEYSSELKKWLTFTDEGLKQGKEGSTYTTLIDEEGFHILQKDEKITTIAKRQVAAEEFRVGKINTTSTRCVLREAGDGGMIITVEGLT